MPRISLIVNGEPKAVETQPGETLLDLLRHRLQLTGAKHGCGEGQCRACTVLMDGRATPACLVPATAAEGKRIVTIEGLAKAGRLHRVQQAFLDKEAFQCGFCTPGMILGATALLGYNLDPDEDAIRKSLNGHICRCGTYPRIVEAVQLAARLKKAGGGA